MDTTEGTGALVEIDDTSDIEAFLRRDAELHVYELGDLDPFFRPRTRWFAWRSAAVEALSLLYSGSMPPTLVALCRPEEVSRMARLLASLEPHLPSRIYAHLSPGLDQCFATWSADRHGRHLKMQLTNRSAIDSVDTSAVIAARAPDIDSLTAFYDDSYHGHWFDARMLESGQYCGIRDGDRWLAVAGVHVYSPAFRVAALGNIATAPMNRRRGLGRMVTAAVCKSLRASIDLIGLNVHRDNAAARRCYEELGFTYVGDYDEVLLERPGTGTQRASPMPSGRRHLHELVDSA